MSSFKYLCVVGVLAVGCGGSSEPPPPAHMLTQESQDALASITRDPADERNATITFSPVPGELADLQVGEIFVLPPTKPLANGGLMFRINSTTRAGNTLTIEGRQPPLSDVYKDDELTADHTLTAADIDMDATMAEVAEFLPGESALVAGLGPRPTPSVTLHWPRIDFTDDFILCEGSMPCSLTGHVTLPDPQFHVAVGFDWSGVNRTEFRVNVDGEIAMEVRGRISTPGIGTSVRLFSLHFAVIPLGVWSWIEPRLTFRLGAKATGIFDVVSSGFSGGVHLQAGSEWTRSGGQRDLGSATATGTSHAEGFSQTTVLADIYNRNEFGFFVYSLSGPYIYWEQGPRLDLATPRHPFVQVGYHVGTGMGGRFDVLDEAILSLIDYSHALYEHTFYFWQSSNSNPAISLYSPSSYTAVQPNDNVGFSVTAYDVEDGPTLDSQVTWSSDLDGTLGTGRNVSHRFFSGGPGTRTVTVTVNDTDGGTDHRTVGINLPAVNPTVTLLDPQSSPTTYPTLTPTAVSANVTSPYFPAGDFCTASGQTIKWESSYKYDDINLAAATGCAGTITFNSAGPRTLTFTATDRWGQTTVRTVTVTAVAAPTCFVTISPNTSATLTNSGSPLSVTLTPDIHGCLPGMNYMVISSTANGGYHERIYNNVGVSVTYTPSTDLADDGFLMTKPFDTALQTIDVSFVTSWDDGLGNTGSAQNTPPLHLHYQWN